MTSTQLCAIREIELDLIEAKRAERSVKRRRYITAVLGRLEDFMRAYEGYTNDQ